MLTWVGGVVINCLILYAIRRYSKPLMGTYKYLLAAFVSFDAFLSIAHAVANPVRLNPITIGVRHATDSRHRWHCVQLRHRSYASRTRQGQHWFSLTVLRHSRFLDGIFQRLTAAYCSFYAVPFTLMNIHFLYRFWSIRYPHLISLFSNKKFIALIVSILTIGFILWWVVISKQTVFFQLTTWC